jgi:hypothetical protein
MAMKLLAPGHHLARLAVNRLGGLAVTPARKSQTHSHDSKSKLLPTTLYVLSCRSQMRDVRRAAVTVQAAATWHVELTPGDRQHIFLDIIDLFDNNCCFLHVLFTATKVTSVNTLGSQEMTMIMCDGGVVAGNPGESMGGRAVR